MPFFAATPILTRNDVAKRLFEKTVNQRSPYLAFFSSILGGIVRDVDLMTVPIDDHLVHRGHAVFDTAIVHDGNVYQLDRHLERFRHSAVRCHLWRESEFPDFVTKSHLKSIILDTIRAAGKKDQSLRYWLGAGPGGFDISNRECPRPSFYVICQPQRKVSPELYETGVTVITSTVPMKAPPFTSIKSTNYLPNAMTVIEANSKGAYMGVWVTKEGLIAECATANVGFVKDDVFLVPSFNQTLTGISVQRMMHLVKTELKMNVIQRDMHIREGLSHFCGAAQRMFPGKAADEAFLFGGNMGALPITQWDDQIIGTGRVGKRAREFLHLYHEDMRHGHGNSDQLIHVEGLSP